MKRRGAPAGLTTKEKEAEQTKQVKKRVRPTTDAENGEGKLQLKQEKDTN